MNVQRPRNSNCHSAFPRWRNMRRRYLLPEAAVRRAMAASSEKKGKKLDGFQLLHGILSKQ
jgi:hypothetical protein